MTRSGARAAAEAPSVATESAPKTTKRPMTESAENNGEAGPEAYLLDSSRPSGYRHVGREVRKKKIKFTAEIYPSGCKGKGIKLGRYSTAKVQTHCLRCTLASLTFGGDFFVGGGACRGQV